MYVAHGGGNNIKNLRDFPPPSIYVTYIFDYSAL